MYSDGKDANADDTAAAWVIRLDRGELSDGEQKELDAWIGSDPRRLGAFTRARAIWFDADRVGALDGGRYAAPIQAPSFRRRSLLSSLAAAIAAVAVVGGAFTAFQYLSGREVTRFGEIRRLTLEDGSNIVLNASSVVQVRFEKNERRVILRRGEATFNVAHDVGRPFVVLARDVAVKAVGTSFSVTLQPRAVAVTVTEGVVEVMRPTETIDEVKLLGRNRQIVALRAQPMVSSPLTDQEVSKRFAWQDGLLVFDGDRLAQAVTQVNRYSPVPVVVDSERLQQREFVGVFRVGDARSFADAAAAAFHAHVSEHDGGLHLTD